MWRLHLHMKKEYIYIYFFFCFLLHNQILNYHPNLLQRGSKPVLSCKCDDNVINLVLAKKKKRVFDLLASIHLLSWSNEVEFVNAHVNFLAQSILWWIAYISAVPGRVQQFSWTQVIASHGHWATSHPGNVLNFTLWQRQNHLEQELYTHTHTHTDTHTRTRI